MKVSENIFISLKLNRFGEILQCVFEAYQKKNLHIFSTKLPRKPHAFLNSNHSLEISGVGWEMRVVLEGPKLCQLSIQHAIFSIFHGVRCTVLNNALFRVIAVWWTLEHHSKLRRKRRWWRRWDMSLQPRFLWNQIQTLCTCHSRMVRPQSSFLHLIIFEPCRYIRIAMNNRRLLLLPRILKTSKESTSTKKEQTSGSTNRTRRTGCVRIRVTIRGRLAFV